MCEILPFVSCYINTATPIPRHIHIARARTSSQFQPDAETTWPFLSSLPFAHAQTNNPSFFHDPAVLICPPSTLHPSTLALDAFSCDVAGVPVMSRTQFLAIGRYSVAVWAHGIIQAVTQDVDEKTCPRRHSRARYISTVIQRSALAVYAQQGFLTGV